jgi:ribosomal protein S18 acetylase RimI-like enzyme
MALNLLLNLRPIRPEDEPFLRDLRAAVDVERLGLHHWPESERALAEKVVAAQFRVHSAHYRRVKNQRDTRDCVIELNGAAVGRFIVTQDRESVYVSDIAVHPNFRGQGIGQAVIAGVQHECEQSRRLLHLHVDRHNTAVHFYAGLGFRVIGQNEVNFLMEWVPTSLVGNSQVFSTGGGS